MLLHAWLVVLGACVVTLEVQRRLLLARVLGALLMLLTWGVVLPATLQLKAAVCAALYHVVAEAPRQWRRRFPIVFERRKHRKVVLWLLFWARVFIWGATLGPVAATDMLQRNSAGAVMLAVYYEMVETLVMLYFADEELPYHWRRRVSHYVGALAVGFLETSGRLDAVLSSTWLVGMSPLALVGVLLMSMWLSIEIPWHQIAEASSPGVVEDFERDERFEDSRGKPELFVDTSRQSDVYYR